MASPLAAAGRPYVSHLRGYGPRSGPGWTSSWPWGARPAIRVHASHLWGAPADIRPRSRRPTRPGCRSASTCIRTAGRAPSWRCCCCPPEPAGPRPGQTLAALADPGSGRCCWRARSSPDSDSTCAHGSYAALAVQRFRATAAPRWRPRPRRPTAGRRRAGARGRRGMGSGPAGQHAAEVGGASGPAGPDRGAPGLAGVRRPAVRRVGRHLPGPAPAPARIRGVRPAGRALPGGGRHGPSGYQRMARHLAANAADAYGLRTRGRLAPGLAADICVIGPGGMTEQASYDAPREHADRSQPGPGQRRHHLARRAAAAGPLPGRLVS